MQWRERGACATEDPELFFPIGSGPHAEEQTARAKRVCQRCEVIDQCLTWALRHGADGVWGGLDGDERRRLSRQTTSRHP